MRAPALLVLRILPQTAGIRYPLADVPDRAIQLRVALAEDEADYIRHARLETLNAIGAHHHPELTAPVPYAVYLLAYESGESRPVGMAEACFLEQHYPSYEHTPYASACNLPAICPFPQLASIRTVFAEPGFRLRHGLYLKLILGAAHIFRSLGALYAAATTNAADERLARLYDKTGGTRIVTFKMEAFHQDDIALYLFELDALLRHPGVPRMLRDLDLSPSLLRIVRSRNRHQPSGDSAAS